MTRSIAWYLLMAVLLLPLSWSLYCTHWLEWPLYYTSSHWLWRTLSYKPPIVTWLFGWGMCRLVSLAMKRRIKWYVIDALVFGGILCGHLMWRLE